MRKVLFGIGLIVMFLLILAATYFLSDAGNSTSPPAEETVTGEKRGEGTGAGTRAESSSRDTGALAENNPAGMIDSARGDAEVDSLISSLFEEVDGEETGSPDSHGGGSGGESDIPWDSLDVGAQTEAGSTKAGSSADTIQVLTQRVAQLEKLLDARSDSIQALLVKVSGAQGKEARKDNLAKLVKVMEEMKPNEMKGIANGLDDQFLIDILVKMKPRNAAKLLAVIEPQRASRISMLMAEN